MTLIYIVGLDISTCILYQPQKEISMKFIYKFIEYGQTKIIKIILRTL